MKSEVISQSKTPEYPCLMQSTVSSAIVLFTEKKVGFLVAGTNGTGKGVGYHTDDWLMENFSPFHGEVKLSN